jgi:predicted RNase H-like HicB family nuclease
LAKKARAAELAERGWATVVTESRLEYLVIYERGDKSYGAYVPDLPGCVAVAETKEEASRLIREAIAAHVEAIVKDGVPVPQPSSSTEYVKV